MQIADAPRSDNAPVESESYNRLCQKVDRRGEKTHSFATLELLPRDAANVPAEHSAILYNLMTTTERKPDRQAVEKVMLRYVEIVYFGVRSAAGSLVIDDSRVKRANRKVTIADHDIESKAERLDFIRNAIIQRATSAPMGKRDDVIATRPDSDGNFQVLRCAAPRRAVAQIVAPKGKGGRNAPAATDRSPQLWKATVAVKLGRLSKVQQRALLQVAIYRIELVEVNNRLQQARTAVGRLGNGKKGPHQKFRQEAEASRAALVAKERDMSDRRNSLVRTRMYRDALDEFWRLCVSDPEVRAYVFREEAA